MIKIPERQRITATQVVAAINKSIIKNLRPPTYREIEQEVGQARQTISDRIDEAVELGLLVRLQPHDGRRSSARQFVPSWYLEAVKEAAKNLEVT